MSLVSDIKLIRTDPTLDLSQKAEKGMKLVVSNRGLSIVLLHWFRQPIWDQDTSLLRYHWEAEYST